MERMFSMQVKYSVPAFWIAILVSLTVHLDPIFAQADFYRGKTITIIQTQNKGQVLQSHIVTMQNATFDLLFQRNCARGGELSERLGDLGFYQAALLKNKSERRPKVSYA